MPKDITQLFTAYRPNLSNLQTMFRFYEDSFAGGIRYTSNTLYLHKHPLETDYEGRLTRAAYNNKCSKFIRNISKYVFGREIKRSDIIDPLLNLLDFFTITQQQQEYPTWWSYNCKQAMVLGEWYLFYDAPSIAQQISLYEYQNGMFEKAICHPIHPENVQWVKYERGELVEFVVNQYFSYTDDNTNRIDCMKAAFTPNEICFYPVDKSQTASNYAFLPTTKPVKIPNPYGVVPVFRLFIDENSDGIGDSLIRDVAPMNNILYNNESEMNEMCRDNIFPSFALPTDESQESIIDKYYPKDEKTKQPLWSKMRFYPHAKESPLTVLNIPVENFTNLMTYCNYESAQMRDVMDIRLTEINQAQSGTSKAYDIREETSMLELFSDTFKTKETQFLIWLAKLTKTTLDLKELSLAYPTKKDFEIMDRSKMLADLKIAKNELAESSITAVKAIKQLVAEKTIGDYISEQDMNDITKEINEFEIEKKEKKEFTESTESIESDRVNDDNDLSDDEINTLLDEVKEYV